MLLDRENTTHSLVLLDRENTTHSQVLLDRENKTHSLVLQIGRIQHTAWYY